MQSVRLCGVSFSYRDPIELFSNLNLTITTGWTGLVGENGCGKSTLLRIIAGDVAPSTGQVAVEPERALRHLCPQRVEVLDSGIERLAQSWERHAVRLRSRLRLEPADLPRWTTLSPGERKRWQIGAALHARPDILLLDEPTNHVDASARDLLVNALSRFRGIGVVVSHDRQLLDELSASTIRLWRGEVASFPGNYSAAREQWQAEQEQTRAIHERARRRERTLARRLGDKRRQQASAATKISARSRIKGPRDSEARSMARKERAMSAEARLSRQVRLLGRAVERAEQEVSRAIVTRERGRSLVVDFRAAPMSTLIHLDLDIVQAGDTPLLRDVHLTVSRESRVHLAGDNGSGKSTLLAGLLTAGHARREHLLYLPQELTTEQASRQRERVAALEASARQRVMNTIAALGNDPDRIMRSQQLSPGEARKMMIAYGLGVQAWAMLLDEPTNHLDLPAIERLQAALADYPGALVMVTHDRALAAAVTDTVWELRARRVVVRGRDDQP